MSAMPAEAEPRRALIARSPTVQGPTVQGPTVLSPTVLSPTVLSPTVLSPTVLTPAALSPTTVRPRQAGLRAVPVAEQRTRPAGQWQRRAGARAHPTGVRACSGILRADPSSATLTVPRVTPSVRGDDSPGLRLTRRGRVVLAVCAAIAASLLGFAAASGAQAADHGVPPGAGGHLMSRIVVQPGQTLWSIALQADPHADPRLVIQQIMAANALPGGNVAAGQRLLVPRG